MYKYLFCVFVYSNDANILFIILICLVRERTTHSANSEWLAIALSSVSLCLFYIFVHVFIFCLFRLNTVRRFRQLNWSPPKTTRLKPKMLQLISTVIMWSLCIVFSVLSATQLLIVYITKFASHPWKPKERPNAPACLSDPKYGVHKFAEVNVSASINS